MSRRRLSGKGPYRVKRGDAFRRALLSVLFVAVLLAVALFFVAALDTPSAEVKRAGTVTGWNRLPPAGLTRPKYLVRLDDGPTVEVAGPDRIVLPKGSRVLVSEQTTRLLGRKTYQFAGYPGGAEPPPGK